MHEVTPAHQLLPPNGLRKSESIGLPLIEIQIDNATPKFQQLFKPSCYSGKDSNTNTSSDPVMHEVTPAQQLLPPKGLRKLESIELPLIEILIDNATPEFQQSGKDSNTNRRPFLKSQRKLQHNHCPPPPPQRPSTTPPGE